MVAKRRWILFESGRRGISSLLVVSSDGDSTNFLTGPHDQAGEARWSPGTLGLGITGIAGPTGATESKPVGLVYVAVSDAQGTNAIDRTFRGDRERVREWAAQLALDLVRRRLI
ncbi:MAG: CinA family protein [Terracidiphilus sp.]